MQRMKITCLTALVAVAVAGCQYNDGSPNRTGTGALAGAGLGAITGAIIGHQSGHAGEGALIGTAVGGLAGGGVGHVMDQNQRRAVAAQSPQTLQRIEQGQPLGLADIKALSRAGVSDEVIMSQIRNSRSAYRLTTAEIIDLKESGVSQRVIDYMINSPSLYPQTR